MDVRAITSDGWLTYHYWQDVLRTDTAIIRFTRPTLVVGGWLLALAAVVTLAALATARATRDNRRAALLKAVVPPAAWLLTAARVIPLAVGALTALPAWIHTRDPAGRALSAEPA